MLYTLRSAGKKYAYDSASGAVIGLNALQLKMLGAIVPPLTSVCPASLRYELAKFDSTDVEEAYEAIYALACYGILYKEDDGKIRIITEGDNACPDVAIAGELLALAFADAPAEVGFETIGSLYKSELTAIAAGEAAKQGKSII